MKRQQRQQEEHHEQAEEIVKVTVRMPRSLSDALQHRAIDERCTMQALVERALKNYLNLKQPKGGRA